MMLSKLPAPFTALMRDLLKDEADEFFATYQQPRTAGLRTNLLKLAPNKLLDMMGEDTIPVPWATSGFYTADHKRPGKHPYYYLGLYYIQEPSAMLPAELLDVHPGHRVLDLCAAPGGKSTQLAAKLQGDGVLVANDTSAERTKALVKNVELSGICNAIVLNEKPQAIADTFGAWFDRVLVDAPCSGEGMFRKNEEMIRDWQEHAAEKYARIQLEILDEASRLVAPGGKLVYSTCTFSPRENEGTIARFLTAHPEFAVIPANIDAVNSLAPGRPDWLTAEESAGLTADQLISLQWSVRIWPHKCQGEGHYVVLLERNSASESGADYIQRQPSRGHLQVKEVTDEARCKFERFRAEVLPLWHPSGVLLARGDSLYAQPHSLPDLKRLRVVRPGWLLGTAGKHRFEPSQAMAMGLEARHVRNVIMLSSSEADCLRYLKGETIQPASDKLAAKGWTLVCIDGFPAGWGRWDGMTLKNARAPGWRWM